MTNVTIFGVLPFLPLAKTQPLCFWQFDFITVNLTKLWLLLSYLQFYIKFTPDFKLQKHTNFLHCLPKTKQLCFASGKNASTSYTWNLMKTKYLYYLCFVLSTDQASHKVSAYTVGSLHHTYHHTYKSAFAMISCVLLATSQIPPPSSVFKNNKEGVVDFFLSISSPCGAKLILFNLI